MRIALCKKGNFSTGSLKTGFPMGLGNDKVESYVELNFNNGKADFKHVLSRINLKVCLKKVLSFPT